MKKLTVYQIDSFTKEKFKGNPAGVVLNAAGLTDEEMLMIARELNNSETAFLFPADSTEYDGIIRYFSPTVEVPICGHATIAAMYAKAISEKHDSCVLRIKTNIGVLPFEIVKEADDYFVIMTQGKFELFPPFEDVMVERLIEALRISREDLDPWCPVQIASTGHSKVMCAINSKELLNNLNPNFSALAEISREIKCNGFYIFTLDSDDRDILVNGRMFAPVIGINEDPVTGNANGPLGGYLVQNGIVRPENNMVVFNAKQGEKINRTGIIKVIVNTEGDIPVKIQIAGQAVAAFKTEIEI